MTFFCMSLQNITEIKRPVPPGRGVGEEQMRERLTKIEMPGEVKKKLRPKLNWRILIVVGVLVVILFIVFLLFKGVIGNGKKAENNAAWQAVFLSDGQVYFGKVVSEDEREVIMQNIYYLQTPGSLQQGGDNLNKQKGEISLIKLGGEIHGPKDEMRINRDQILFIEDLKADSQVVEAIKRHEGK